jgi:hypothetical protein
MEKQLLKDPMVKPELFVLEEVLGKNFARYDELEKKANEKNLIFEWHYYNDGKSWLCKILYKKKNLCWLSIWETGVKLTFYFTEKTITGVFALDIGSEIKELAVEAKKIGKLMAVHFPLKNKKTISDALKLLDYKMALK